MSSSSSSGGVLALVLLGGVVVVVCIGELPRLLQRDSAPVSSAPSPVVTPLVVTPPVALPPVIAPAPPPPPVPPAAPPPPDLAARLNAELPAAGLPPSAKIIETRVAGDHLTLIFDGALRESLRDISALDEWIEALSQRAAKLGYSHLALRIRVVDSKGAPRDVTIDSLVVTPASARPRPEPLDDGVRR